MGHLHTFVNMAIIGSGNGLEQQVITVKWGNFGRWGNIGQYKTFILSNTFCHLKNNLVVNMEVKGYL